MTEKIKFSGMSYPDGTTIYGKRYGVQIDKDGYKIIKKGAGLPIFLFPILDLVIIAPLIIMSIFKRQILAFFVAHMSIDFFYNANTSGWVHVLNTVLGVLNYGLPILILGVVLWFWYKHRDFLLRLARWHGCEHKVIDAAEKGEIELAELSSPVNVHCGSTYAASLYTAMGIWLFFVKIPVGLSSLMFLVMYFESKFWHDKNWIGIKIGSWLQKKALTREPTPEMLEIAKRGISALMVRERNG